ncbi:MAG TPA: cytochrome C biogenesis protein CcdA [Nitrospiraceae bacterium]|jgi:periplasmic divalent cation tolerance protein|nr:cytochrome C biogenesis protein CcdA [Nitrospiraceae bacterium]
MQAIVVFITASNEDEAAKIALSLVKERLAGCVNIIKGIRSIYSWMGKIQDEAEVLMIAKTRESLFDALARKVKELHSYTVPEILAFPVIKGSADYLTWLEEVTDSTFP